MRDLNGVAVDDMGLAGDVRFTPESGHSEGSRKESAFDPKRTLMDFAIKQAGTEN